MNVPIPPEIATKLRALIAEVSGRDDLPEAGRLTDAKLTDDLGLDSLDVINLLFRIDEDLGVKVPDDAIDEHELALFANLARYVAERAG